MSKRFLALLLCFALCLSLLPGAFAEDIEIVEEEIDQEICIVEETANCDLPCAASADSFSWPVTSTKRINALDHYSSGGKHGGIDIAASDKSVVYAVAAGKVVKVGNTCPHYNGYKDGDTCGEGYGNYIAIEHNIGGTTYTSLYAHLTQNSMLVSKGDSVSAGQQIAKSGSSGNSSGPHLHLEIYEGKLWSASKDTRGKSFQYYLNNAAVLSGMTFSEHNNTSSAYFGTWIENNCTLVNGVWRYGGSSNVPGKPTLTTDKSVYTKGDTISISWNPVQGNEFYCINIYRNNALVYEANLGKTTYYKLANAQVGSYRILVSANNSAGQGLAECSVKVVEGESTLALSGASFPSGHYDTLPNFGLRGVFSSNYTITWITAFVKDSNDNIYMAYDKAWDKTQYDIQNDGLNSAFSFGSLSDEAYYFYISATDSSGKTVAADTFFDIGTTAPATYTVSYNANGGQNAPDAQTKVQDVPLTLSSVIPERKGFIFLGWATSPDSAIVHYNPGSVYSANNDIVLYALWVPDTPEIWTSSPDVYLDLSGENETAVYYFYSGDTEYGYGLTKEVGDPSIVDSSWGENGEECVRLTGLKPGSTYLWIALVEYNTGTILDEAYCSVVVTDSEAPTINGYCGDDLYWTLDNNGTLRIQGTGEMWNYSEENPAPWFEYRDNINEVFFDDEVTSIGAYAFFELEQLKWIQFPYYLTRINDRALARCCNLKNYTLPPNLSYLEPYALSGCDSITEVFLPATLTEIGYAAFEFCGSLTSIEVSEDNPNYYSLDGALIQREDWLLHSFPAGISGEVYIPEEVSAIGLSAFSGCKNLTEIIFQDVTDIGTYAFYCCFDLQTIQFCGQAPVFHGDCFLGNNFTVLYPQNDSTWNEDVMQDYNGDVTWKPYVRISLGDEALPSSLPVFDTLILCAVHAGIPSKSVEWESSNENVAKVEKFSSATVAVAAHKYGKCTITAIDNGKSCCCQLQTLFWDVADPSVYYFKHVYWAAEKGITKGYDLEYFDPQGECTREQMMTFLWRLAGQPDPTTTSSNFSDVKKGSYYYKAVLWGVEKGITNGYTSGPYAGKFGVGLACTREQAMTFLWRMAGKPNPTTTTNKFKDVKKSDYFYKAVLWASENKIANGYADGTYGVGKACLREHMVTFLSRYYDKFMA